MAVFVDIGYAMDKGARRRDGHGRSGGGLTRRAHGAEEDGIILLQRLQSAFRDVVSMLLVVVTTPFDVVEVKDECPYCYSEFFKDLDTGADYFGADTVGGDGGYRVDFADIVACS